jgi:hypothetical protein
VRPAVMRLAARYLLRERRRGAALDPVANFHLRNGARNAMGQGPCPVATSSLRPADGSDARASAVVLVTGALHRDLKQRYKPKAARPNGCQSSWTQWGPAHVAWVGKYPAPT